MVVDDSDHRDLAVNERRRLGNRCEHCTPEGVPVGRLKLVIEHRLDSARTSSCSSWRA